MVRSLLAEAAEISHAGFPHLLPTQREKDSESALMHYRARSYDPRVGRFVQVDPLAGYTSSDFAYVGGRPTFAVDPSGRRTEILKIGNAWVLLTFVQIATDIGVGSLGEVENALAIGLRLAEGVHNTWNNGGSGW